MNFLKDAEINSAYHLPDVHSVSSVFPWQKINIDFPNKKSRGKKTTTLKYKN